MKRGEIWWADFGEPQGSETGFQRPVLVVQPDGFNRSRIATVIVVPFTSNLRLADPRATSLPTKQTPNFQRVPS